MFKFKSNNVYRFLWWGVGHIFFVLVSSENIYLRGKKNVFILDSWQFCHYLLIQNQIPNQGIFYLDMFYISYLFIIWITFFFHKEPFVKQKGSLDLKGSSWNI